MKIELEEIKNIKKEFLKVKRKDYIKGAEHQKQSCINNEIKTFINLISHNTKAIKWLGRKDVTIKLNKAMSRQYQKLFIMSPLDKEQLEPIRLKNQYGYNLNETKIKILECSVQANCNTLVGGRFQFKLEINYEEEKVYLVVSNRNFTVIEKKVYWTFEDLQKRVDHKFKYLVILKVWSKKIEEQDWYKYYDIEFFKLKDFYMFLKLIEDGTIRVTFKVTINKNKSYHPRQVTDHGTSFEIQDLDIEKLYNKIEW